MGGGGGERGGTGAESDEPVGVKGVGEDAGAGGKLGEGVERGEGMVDALKQFGEGGDGVGGEQSGGSGGEEEKKEAGHRATVEFEMAAEMENPDGGEEGQTSEMGIGEEGRGEESPKLSAGKDGVGVEGEGVTDCG